jgi:hypothetical protein
MARAVSGHHHYAHFVHAISEQLQVLSHVRSHKACAHLQAAGGNKCNPRLWLQASATALAASSCFNVVTS